MLDMSAMDDRRTMQAHSDCGAPYSTAVSCGNLVFLSGLVSEDPETGCIIGDTICDQTRVIFERARVLLGRCHSSLEYVLRAEIYLTDLSDSEGMNEVFRQYFPNDPPARLTVEVRALYGGAKIEVVLLAATPGGASSA